MQQRISRNQKPLNYEIETKEEPRCTFWAWWVEIKSLSIMRLKRRSVRCMKNTHLGRNQKPLNYEIETVQFKSLYVRSLQV